MKKIKYIVGLGVLLSCFSLTFASQCVDLQHNLVKGSKGASVTLLQKFLVDEGYLQAEPNGYFGAGTLKAVKKFQSKNRLSPVGSVGVKTRSVIKDVSCGVPSVVTQPVTVLKSPSNSFVKTCVDGITEEGVGQILVTSSFAPTSNKEDVPGLISFQKQESISPSGHLDAATKLSLCEYALGGEKIIINQPLRMSATTTVIANSGVKVLSAHINLPEVTINGSGLDAVTWVDLSASNKNAVYIQGFSVSTSTNTASKIVLKMNDKDSIRTNKFFVNHTPTKKVRLWNDKQEVVAEYALPE
jgi:hypothetical protein